MQDTMDSKLRKWQSNLIDMSRKNSLLAFKGSRASSVQIPSTIESLYGELVRDKAVTVQDYFPFEEMALGSVGDPRQAITVQISHEENDRVREAVSSVLERRGWAVVADPDRLEELLYEACPDVPQVQAILNVAQQQQLLEALLSAKQPPDHTRFESIVNKLVEASDMETSLAEWALSVWCDQIGKSFDLEAHRAASLELSLNKAQELVEQEQGKLDTRLNKIRQNANLVLRERGVNVLYLAFGFLRWYEPERKSLPWKSPLFLMPVQLVRGTHGQRHRLRPLDEEMIVNPILLRKMQLTFGIELPELPKDYRKKSLPELFALYQQMIRVHPTWQLQQEVYLGMFQFSKLAMYQDFESFAPLMREHPIIKQIAGSAEETGFYGEAQTISIEEHDRTVPTQESFQVLDADSSQQEAIVAAKNGSSFIMQGPPGTGKSQTIANIIAELLADGKTILFMSEKMAALEVVKNRLEKRSIGPFLLELHSNKVNKKQVIEDLGRTYKLQEVEQERPFAFSRVDELKKELNDYLDLLHTPVEPLGVTPYQAHGRLAQLSKVPDLQFPLHQAERYTWNHLDKVGFFLQHLDQNTTLLVDDKKYLWEKTHLKRYTQEVETQILAVFSRLATNLKQIDQWLRFCVEKTGLQEPMEVANMERFFGLRELMHEVPSFLESWFRPGQSPSLATSKSTYEQASKLYLTYQQIRTEFLQGYEPSVLNINTQTIEHSLKHKFQEFLDRNAMDRERLLTTVFQQGKELEKGVKELGEVVYQLSDLLMGAHRRIGIALPSPTLELLQLIQSLYLQMADVQVVPTTAWFDTNRHRFLLSNFRKLQAKSNELLEGIAEISQKFHTVLLDEDSRPILERFEQRYPAYFVDHSALDLVWQDQSAILPRMRQSLSLIHSLQETQQELVTQLGLSGLRYTTGNLTFLIEISQALRDVTVAPAMRWFDLNVADELQKRLKTAKEKTGVLHQQMARLQQSYQPELVQLNVKPVLQRMQHEYAPLFKQPTNLDQAWNEPSEFGTQLQTAKSGLEKLRDHNLYVEQLLGFSAPAATKEKVHVATKLLQRLSGVRAMPTAAWFQPLQHEEVQKHLQRARQTVEELLRDRAELFKKYEEEVLSLDFREIQDRVVTQYESFLRFMKSSYRQDVRRLKYHLKDSAKIQYAELKQDVKLAHRIQEKQRWLAQEQPVFKEWLGPHYDGLETNWERLQSSFDCISKICGELVGQGISLEVMQRFYRGLPDQGLSLDVFNQTLETRASELEFLLQAIAESIQYLQQHVNAPAAFVGDNGLLAEQLEWLVQFEQIASHYQSDIEQVKRYRTAAGHIRFEELVADLQRVVELQQLQEWLQVHEEEHLEWFGSGYQGLHSNWSELEKGIAAFRNISTAFDREEISMNGMEAMYRNQTLQGQSQGHLIEGLHKSFGKTASELQDLLQQLGVTTTDFYNLLCCPQPLSNQDVSLSDLASWLERFEQETEHYRRDLASLDGHRIETESATSGFEAIVEELRLVVRAQENQRWLREKEEESREWYGAAYRGTETNWESIEISMLAVGEMVRVLSAAQLECDTLREYLQTTYLNEKEVLQKELETLQQLLQRLEQRTVAIKEHLACPDAFQSPTLSFHLLTQWVQQMKAALGEWNEIQSYLSKFLTGSENLTYQKSLHDLEMIKRIVGLDALAQKNRPQYEQAFGHLFQEHQTDWAYLERSMDWAQQLQDFLKGDVPEALVHVLQEKDDATYLSCLQKLDGIEEIWQGTAEDRVFLDTVFSMQEPHYQGQLFAHAPLSGIIKQLFVWTSYVRSLDDWLQMQKLLAEANDLGIKPFVESLQITKEAIYHEQPYTDLFERRFYSLWLHELYQRTGLNEFVLSRHEEQIKQFKTLDQRLADTNTNRLLKRLISNKQSYLSLNKSFEERQILEREMQKQRMHKSIRTLYKTIPNLLSALKPCVMMSPLTVSEYIDPELVQFDVVIFDEASQIRSEEAIGAILRGKQVIIAGDNKQLPPTSFFDSVGSGQQEEQESVSPLDDEYESILDECSLFLNPHPLQWHYRSKHESLIAFSNHHLYEDKLFTFPSAASDSHNGVSLVHVKDAVYDRGRSRKNIREAERVVQLVIEHMKRTPQRSLGVIAFSSAQEEAIRDQLEKIRHRYPQLDDLFDEDAPEAFFIKNLENVQGDERDTILFSIGYGRDKNGAIYYNFGPLNKIGGERRLNVAVTRARYEIKVVSSILDTDLEDSKLNRKGAVLLKKYLYYARTKGNLQTIAPKETKEESSQRTVEADVYNTLRELGYQVEQNVGYSDYRLDLAIVHPQHKTRYVLGIACDGLSYRSGKTVRDRERLRFQVLESLGWTIYRVWSQNWMNDKEREIRKLRRMIDRLIDAPTHVHA